MDCYLWFSVNYARHEFLFGGNSTCIWIRFLFLSLRNPFWRGCNSTSRFLSLPFELFIDFLDFCQWCTTLTWLVLRCYIAEWAKVSILQDFFIILVCFNRWVCISSAFLDGSIGRMDIAELDTYASKWWYIYIYLVLMHCVSCLLDVILIGFLRLWGLLGISTTPWWIFNNRKCIFI